MLEGTHSRTHRSPSVVHCHCGNQCKPDNALRVELAALGKLGAWVMDLADPSTHGYTLHTSGTITRSSSMAVEFTSDDSVYSSPESVGSPSRTTHDILRDEDSALKRSHQVLNCTNRHRRGSAAFVDWLHLGAEVHIQHGRWAGKSGVVRFIGRVHFGSNIWVGVEVEAGWILLYGWQVMNFGCRWTLRRIVPRAAVLHVSTRLRGLCQTSATSPVVRTTASSAAGTSKHGERSTELAAKVVSATKTLCRAASPSRRSATFLAE